MGTLAAIDARALSSYARREWNNNRSCLETVQEKAALLADRVLLIGPGQELDFAANAPAQEIFAALRAFCDVQDAVFYLYADEPFLDTALAQTMLQNHLDYRADYTFAEGYPAGLTPQIVAGAALERLEKLADSIDSAGRGFIFETLKQDMNDFDIETEIAPKDKRAERLALNYQTKNNATIANNFLRLGALDAAGVLEAMESHPEALIGLPAYYNVQIASNCPQSCLYCPYPKFKNFNQNRFMDLALFEKFLDEAAAFSGEAVIGLSLFGEPALHPHFGAFMQAVLKRAGLQLHVETSGLGWKEADWDILAALDKSRYTLILSLDALDKNIYASMRGSGYEEAQAFYKRALAEIKGNLWVQSVRLARNEAALESFYRAVEAETKQVIIQKYDYCCGLLPQEKAADIAPLIRNVCWALKREAAIGIDGSLFLCKETTEMLEPLGNVFKENIASWWAKADSWRKAHSCGQYPEYCKVCDEYYVFNF